MSSLRLLGNAGYKATLTAFSRPQSTMVPLRLVSRTNSTLAKSAQPKSILFPKQVVMPARTAATVASANHWNAERYLSAALVGIIPAALLLESNYFDQVLALSLVVHSHWGLSCILTDYVHGSTAPKVAQATLAVVSVVSLIGLIYFNFSDIGLSKAIKKVWTL